MHGLTVLAHGLMSLLWGAAGSFLNLGLAESKARLCLLASIAVDSVGSVGPSVVWELTVVGWVRGSAHGGVVIVAIG